MSSPELDTRVLKNDEIGDYELLFESCPNALAQQSVSWSKAISPMMADVPYFLVTRDRSANRPIAGLPLYFFAGASGNILTSVPHAGPLGGVLCRPDLSPQLKEAAYSGLLQSAMDLALELRCMALSIITNPFEQDAPLYQKSERSNFVFSNFCQVMDLQTLFDPNGNLIAPNRNCRRNLKKAHENGLVVRWGTLNDFPAWYSIHQKRHGELGAIPLPEEILRGILVHVAPRNAGLLVVEKDGVIIGGVILIWNRAIADVFIMSTSSESLELGANYLLTEFFLKEFKEMHLRWVNWQSCPRNSGVYEFKVRWGSVEVPYAYLTWTLPGIENIFKRDLEIIVDQYRWHYVLPFEAIKKQEMTGVYSKG